MTLSRRDLIATCSRLLPLAGGAALAAAAPASARRLMGVAGADPFAASRFQEIAGSAPRARFWTSTAIDASACQACHTGRPTAAAPHVHDPKTVKCLLCAHGCVIRTGERGRCRARANVDGQLRSLVYGRPAAVHVDPIEKKPFYHFLPGKEAYSFGTTGCPFRCKFCQNWELSQSSPEDLETRLVPAAELAGEAASREVPVIAFTYNEPTVFAEYLLDVAREAKARGLRTALVSCGFMNEAPLDEMCGVLDAIKIDLKGFSEPFYRSVSDASLRPVLRSIRQIRRRRVHLEIVNLVVPTLNDAEQALGALADWVAGELGPDVPLHFTRFHPDYQLRNLPPTPIGTLEKARQLAMGRGLRYVYTGNVADHPGNHTYCPGCRKVVVRRSGFFVTAMHVTAGRCAFCRRAIAGVWT